MEARSTFCCLSKLINGASSKRSSYELARILEILSTCCYLGSKSPILTSRISPWPSCCRYFVTKLYLTLPRSAKYSRWFLTVLRLLKVSSYWMANENLVLLSMVPMPLFCIGVHLSAIFVSKVDLPVPDAPIIARTSPVLTSKLCGSIISSPRLQTTPNSEFSWGSEICSSSVLRATLSLLVEKDSSFSWFSSFYSSYLFFNCLYFITIYLWKSLPYFDPLISTTKRSITHQKKIWYLRYLTSPPPLISSHGSWG